MTGAVASVPMGVSLAYLIAGALFMLALRSLSRPESGCLGNRLGMAGMALAVGTTIAVHSAAGLPQIGAAIFFGAAIGIFTVRRVAMPSLPQLIAAFHSLAGLVATLVSGAAFIDPGAFGLLQADGLDIPFASRTAIGLTMAIGAIIFSGSIIACLKLAGILSIRSIPSTAHHAVILALLIVMLALVALVHPGALLLFCAIIGLGLLVGLLLLLPVDRADMPAMLSILNSGLGWAAAAMGFAFHNVALVATGALVGASSTVFARRFDSRR